MQLTTVMKVQKLMVSQKVNIGVTASDLPATCPPSAALQALEGGCESARRGGRERSNLLQCTYLNLRDCFVVEFILSIAEGLLAMTAEKTFYELIKKLVL